MNASSPSGRAVMMATARFSSSGEKKRSALVMLAILALAFNAEAGKASTDPIASVLPHNFSTSASSTHEGRQLVLVEPPPIILTYHNGSLLTSPIPVYLIWYGNFGATQKAILRDFFKSFSKCKEATRAPSVRSWWHLTSAYKNVQGASVTPSLFLAGEANLMVAKGNTLSRAGIQALVVRSLKKLPTTSRAIYAVFTSANIQVESFCMSSCASHFSSDKVATKGKELSYLWVGNPATQCPGLCAWPFAKPQYGPPDFVPLLPPNNDVGIDGMTISLGSMLAGIATNPSDAGYYQGDAADPLEAATACTGIYGAGAYPGYPGQLLIDAKTKSSYNVNGCNYRRFLLPALWDPTTSLCTPP